MDARVGPQDRGGRLVPRLYLLLVAIFLPTLAAYYFYNKRVMETLQEREVDDTIHKAAFQVEGLLGGFDLAWLVKENIFVPPEEVARKKADRERLEGELKRVVTETMGLEGAAVFAAEGDRGLTGIARAGAGQERPSFEDVEAVYVQGRTLRNDTMRGGERILAVSIPVTRWNAAEKREDSIGAIHLDVSPANIGLRFPDWQRGLLLGALGTMLLLGLGVAVFVHTAVRRPALELVDAMQRASEGNLSALVEPRTGEMGWLAGAYNQMMRRLKHSMDENGRLLTQIQGFNEELKRKVASATHELEQRNTEL
ncbi:MAG: HAMP domain-containing protein, partial [Planctomycetota bacterium]